MRIHAGLEAGVAAAILVASGALGGCTKDQGIYALELGEVAMVTGDFDTTEEVLDKLDVTFTLVDGFINGPMYSYEPDYDWTAVDADPVEEFLATWTTLGQYDVVFLSCGMRGAGRFVYNDSTERDDQVVLDEDAVANLRKFVETGGYVYATDWTYDLVEAAFPDAIDFLGDDLELDAAQVGEPQEINGRVVDEALAEYLELSSGAEVAVDYNYDAWAVIEGVGSGTDVLLEGDFVYKDGADHVGVTDAPISVIFGAGDRGGKVIYTTFHTEAQFTTDVQNTIDYLVLQFGQAEG